MEAQPLTDWDASLCDCFEDVSTCCYGFWCCPCIACTVSERFGESRLLPLCDLCARAGMCIPPAVLSLRVAMRNRYGIKGSICKDILASCFCEWCSWCQMHRELKHRKKTPVVHNMSNQTIVQMQPYPLMMGPAYPYPPQGGFMGQGVPPQE
ncbi:placenta-specific gene 8 protein-like [Plectropomus leopardus]|uniref:placenta-specific gene 8 protein-like n=1 Tax=Plectropomus leopardus TaxID=160734 RepID=UPI001C4D6FF1|nr:placenta-specific gene 8 protein-like [Plectropomus leopardus]